MNHVIDLNKDTIVELRLPPAEGAGDEQPPSLLVRLVPLDPAANEDTAGFIQDAGSDFAPGPIVPLSLAGLKRLVVVCDPRPGPPVQVTAQEVRGFMMKSDPKKEGQPAASDSGYGSGAPIGLAFEWLGNPSGTFVKYFFG